MKKREIKLLALVLPLLLISCSIFAQDGFISAKNFAETQGISYQWFPIQKMIVMRKGLRSVKLTVNKTTAIVDNREVVLPAAPVIKDGQIMVPAAAVIRAFQGELQSAPVNKPPANALINDPPPVIPPRVSPEPPRSNLNQPAPIKPPSNLISPEDQADAILVALRHSVREDHTRVVLEFNDNVSYKTEMSGDNFRLIISGCRNLVPTRRTNPVGRDIEKLDINSGPNRSGLILTFKCKQTNRQPEIETIANPFRMIISFFSDTAPPVATASPTIAQKPENSDNNKAFEQKSEVKKVPQEVAPEINIEIPLESLSNEAFKGRTIVIDPGHGGADTGFEVPGRMPEKAINLSVAKFLKSKLESVGFNAILLRNADVEVPQSQRLSIANRNGADLFIGIHVGGSNDKYKAGVACVVYGKSGTEVPENDAGLSEGAVYKEWLENTRFDLASFLARRVNERLKTQLKVESRGIKQLPMLPLKYLLNPAILVEVGMLSEPTEGKNLLSSKYHEAIASCITNGVVDFFNGIVIKP
ncbi:MAG: hypothetical protein Kow0029_17710 [Candidatus Rifleibacteriota bacterium]